MPGPDECLLGNRPESCVENEFGEKFYKTFARCIARDPWINEDPWFV